MSAYCHQSNDVKDKILLFRLAKEKNDSDRSLKERHQKKVAYFG